MEQISIGNKSTNPRFATKKGAITMKYNLSAITRRANRYAAAIGKSRAFKKAWAEAKVDRLENELFTLKMKDVFEAEDFLLCYSLNDKINEQRKVIAAMEPQAHIAEDPRKANTWLLLNGEYVVLRGKYAADPAALRRLERAYSGWAGLESVEDLRDPAPVFDFTDAA
jgi:hypothetical protein